MRRLPALLLLAGLLLAPAAAEEDYAFDVSEIERTPAEIGGYVELRPSVSVRDENAAAERPRADAGTQGRVQEEYRATLLLDGSYGRGMTGIHARTHTALRGDGGQWSAAMRFYEGYLALKPQAGFSTTLGKRTLKWGKGYAWNPVAFVDRPKDPNEPDLALEGFVVASADYIRSFEGPLKTVSFTPVLAPVYKGLNEDLGTPGKLNAGGKLYLLLFDTDIDLVFLGGGSRPPQYGLDFSRNVASNFEVHGEFAYRPHLVKRSVAASGVATSRRGDAASFLAGLRYLTPSETTFILEYYRNGGGYTAGEMRDYFGLVERAQAAYLASGDDGLLRQARAATSWGYGKPHAMRDYLYLRVSQKDALGVVYFSPSLTAIANLNDRSLSLTQELLYAPVTNVEIRARLTALVGGRHTELGEKPGNLRAELMARRHF